VRPFVDTFAATTKGKIAGEDIFESAAKGLYQIWVIYEPDSDNVTGMILTELRRFPRQLSCAIIGSAGAGIFQMDSKRVIGQISDWARFQGCTTILCEGRLDCMFYDWARHLGDGFEEISRLWEKEL